MDARKLYQQQSSANKFFEATKQFLVICAATGRARSTVGILFQKYIYSTFSMKMVLNCIHIWSIDLFLVKDKVLGRKLIKIASL